MVDIPENIFNDITGKPGINKKSRRGALGGVSGSFLVQFRH